MAKITRTIKRNIVELWVINEKEDSIEKGKVEVPACITTMRKYTNNYELEEGKVLVYFKLIESFTKKYEMDEELFIAKAEIVEN